MVLLRSLTRAVSKVAPSQDRGSLSAFVVCIAMTMVCLVGLAHDGGRVVAAYGEASDAAAAAARMGDQFVVGIREGRPRVDEQVGRRVVSVYLGTKGLAGEVSVRGGTVTVRVTRSVPMVLLSLFGVGQRTITVTRSAELVEG